MPAPTLPNSVTPTSEMPSAEMPSVAPLSGDAQSLPPSASTLSLILPVLNEAENLAALIPELLAGVPGLVEILVMDDGSTDGTPETVEALAREDGRIRVVRRRGPASLTASLAEGVALARGNLVGWMDADGTMGVDDLVRLTEAVEGGAALAVGSRFAAGGGMKGQSGSGFGGLVRALRGLRQSQDALLPVLLSWGLNAVVLPRLLGDGVRDYTSGFIVGRREVIASIEFFGSHGEYFIGLWAQARAARHVVVEVPYHARPRFLGRSKSITSPRDYYVRSRQYLGAALNARRFRSPRWD